MSGKMTGTRMPAAPRRLVRLSDVYGRGGMLPVGRSTFYKDYIQTGRVRLVPLGPRIRAVVEDEITEIVDEIIAERDNAERDIVGT